MWSWCGGFESGGLGARAMGMGGAYIGVADDWTAIYWNPAGLSRLKGKGIGAAVEYLRVITHDSQGLVNASVPFTQANLERADVFSQLGGEPTHFNGQDSDFRIPLPGLGFYGVVKGITVAGGSYTPLGFAFKVADGKEPGYNASYKSQGSLVNYNVSLAKTFFSWVHVGTGVNLVQARLYRSSDKIAPGYESSISADAKTYAFQGVFGLLIDVGSHLHIGSVYRTGQDLKLHGHAGISDGRFPAEASDFTQTIRNPTTYGVGISLVPMTSLTCAVDWQRTEWSATRTDIRFDQQGLLLQNQNFNPGWRSTNRYRFGLEWRPVNAWSFRGGFFRDPQAVSTRAQALTTLIDPDSRFFTSGLSFHHASWQISISSQNGTGKMVVDGRNIKKEVNSLTTGFDYFY